MPSLVNSSPFTVFYVGLEQYASRYTSQLTDWNVRVFKSMKIKHVLVGSEFQHEDKQGIKVGQVLDAFKRSRHAMRQIDTLLQLIAAKKIKHGDFIFFEDMFHPGLEALAYALNQLKPEDKPFIVMRCLAQTIDPDDFVHVVPEMAAWMRHFEAMALEIADAVFVASEEMVAHMTIAGSAWSKVPVYITGLPFGKAEVLERTVKMRRPFHQRKLRVVFAARTDQEKQPEFFIELARRYKANYGNLVEFSILSGKKLSSNSAATLLKIQGAKADKIIKVYDNLSKDAYYELLADSRVLFNCALQDWVSNTVSEADALGTNVLYPAYRSFPETFENDYSRLYVPWSLADAEMKLDRLLLRQHPNVGRISNVQDQSITKTIQAMANMHSGSSLYSRARDFTSLKTIYPSNVAYRKRIVANAIRNSSSSIEFLDEYWNQARAEARMLALIKDASHVVEFHRKSKPKPKKSPTKKRTS